MSFGGSRVGALGGPGTPLRPAGSRKNILEPGGAGGGGRGVPRRVFPLFLGTGREDSHLLKN